jgi:hypothetical protein
VIVPSILFNFRLSGFCAAHGPVRSPRVPIVEDLHVPENQLMQVVENDPSLPLVVSIGEEPTLDLEKSSPRVVHRPQESDNHPSNGVFSPDLVSPTISPTLGVPDMKLPDPNQSVRLPSPNFSFEFRLGEDLKSRFSGEVSLIPLMRTPLSQSILDLRSLNWTKVLTHEKFERAQLDFHGGFTNSKSCVFGVEASAHLLPKIEVFRNDALGCILDGWEFLLLIHRSHYIYSIMAQECGDETNKELLLNGHYYLLGFTKGWRLTQKKAPTSRKEPRKEIITPVDPQKKRPKSQEISKSNYIIKDFGKAKILKPLSSFPVPTTTTILKSSEHRKPLSNQYSTSSSSLSQKDEHRTQQVRRSGELENFRKSSHTVRPNGIYSSFTQSSGSYVDSNGSLELNLSSQETSPRNICPEASEIYDVGISDLTSVPSSFS